MPLGIRGANPIWVLVNLAGKLFDDRYYMWILENQIPYAPATVFQDPDLNVPWTDPIQFLGNGTLPDNIYFESNVTYRLEFREHFGLGPPSQSDPLIYLVENYMPGAGTVTPGTNGVSTSNQVTNPQFALINFASPFTFSGSAPANPINIAPGWFLSLAGSGTVTITQVPLNNTLPNPTNAPYALRIQLSGWTANSVFLTQRFQQNGMLWANLYVASTITAALGSGSVSSGPLNATLIDSNASVLANILNVPTLDTTFNEYTGVSDAPLPASTNPNLPPAAYIEYQLSMPSNFDIYITSIQVIAESAPAEPSFSQDSVDRQIDQTFHIYKNSILLQPKESLLTGWNFGLNPWQAITTAATFVPANQYTADQTVIIQQRYVSIAAGNNVSTAQAGFAQNDGLVITAVNPDNIFGLMQYIDPVVMRPYWGSKVSALVKLSALKQVGSSPLRVKMRLFWIASLPNSISQTDPVATWAAGNDPVFAAGYTAIAPLNDPVYQLPSGNSVLTFDQFTLPASTNANMTLGVMIYTIDTMNSTGTPDNIVFNEISLVPNDFAIDCNVLDYDETLRRCQYYYETSFLTGAAVGTSVSAGQEIAVMQGGIGSGSNANVWSNSFGRDWNVIKRGTPSLLLYSGQSSTAGKVQAWGIGTSGTGDGEQSIATFWSSPVLSAKNFYLQSLGHSAGPLVTSITNTGNTEPISGWIYYHYVSNARLGV